MEWTPPVVFGEGNIESPTPTPCDAVSQRPCLTNGQDQDDLHHR